MKNTALVLPCMFLLICASSVMASPFQVDINGTMKDIDTGLIWQQSTTASLNWPDANKYCNQLEINNLSNWRLAYKLELIGLMQKEAKDEAPSDKSPSKLYWTSSPVEHRDDSVWAVHSESYETSEVEKASNQLAVRCLSESAETVYLPLLHAWTRAWSTKNIDDYLRLYGRNFIPGEGKTRNQWENHRKQRINNSKSIKVKLSNIQVISELGNSAEIKFTQNYSSRSYKDQVVKVLTLSLEEDKLVIVGERTL